MESGRNDEVLDKGPPLHRLVKKEGEFREWLTRFLAKKDNPLVGCIRRGIWTYDDPPTDFDLERGAWLEAIGTFQRIWTPVAILPVYTYDRSVIRLYGGSWKGWWLDDLEDEWCLVQTYSGIQLGPYGWILQMEKGRVTPHCYTIEIDDETAARRAGYRLSLANKEVPGRLAKNGTRAYLTCKHCPVKRRCDSVDALEPGGKDDWGRSYPFP